MAEYNECEAARDVCERPPITQTIKGRWKEHLLVVLSLGSVFAKENQPCIKCTRYIPAADAIEELSKPRWIPVTERLPDEYAVVLLIATTGEAIVGYYDSEHKIYCDMSGFRRLCTHWMPLPEPPKEEM